MKTKKLLLFAENGYKMFSKHTIRQFPDVIFQSSHSQGFEKPSLILGIQTGNYLVIGLDEIFKIHDPNRHKVIFNYNFFVPIIRIPFLMIF